MNLQQAGLTLADVDLGAGDAEADTRLAEYFVKTPYVITALNLRRKLLLGRKGAGKSALFSQLPALIRAQPGAASALVLKLTPDQYAWDALRTYSEIGLTPEQAHANAWKFTIAIEVAAALVADGAGTYQTQAALAAHGRLQRFVQENYGVAPPTVQTTAKRLLGGVKAFNLSAFGFGAGLTLNDQEQQLTPSVIEALLTSIGEVTADRGVVVALDKLDDSWEGSNASKQLMIGLLKAAKDINDRFSVGAPLKGVAVLVFLRVDIYEGLTFDDKDKHRATEHPLMWTPELLKQMTQFRLPQDVTVDELFEAGDMRGSITPFNYIVKRTFLRPREVIQFLQECIRRAKPGDTRISKDQVREAEVRYSAWKLEDLKQEYRRLYPEIDKVLESLRQGPHRYESVEELEEQFKSKGVVNAFLGTRRLTEMLFNCSAIGVRLRDSGTARFRCEDGDLELPPAGAVYVHQCLSRGLSLVERRAKDEPAEQDPGDPPSGSAAAPGDSEPSSG